VVKLAAVSDRKRAGAGMRGQHIPQVLGAQTKNAELS